MIEIRGQDKVEGLIGKEFQGDFAVMAGHLKIMNRRMVLLNPKFMHKKKDNDGGVIVDITTKTQESIQNNEEDNTQQEETVDHRSPP